MRACVKLPCLLLDVVGYGYLNMIGEYRSDLTSYQVWRWDDSLYFHQTQVNLSYATWWPTLQTMQMVLPDDQIFNQSKLCLRPFPKTRFDLRTPEMGPNRVFALKTQQLYRTRVTWVHSARPAHCSFWVRYQKQAYHFGPLPGAQKTAETAWFGPSAGKNELTPPPASIGLTMGTNW